MKNIQEINDGISKVFEEKESFSIVRLGNMEGYFIDCYEKGTEPLPEFYNWISLTSGVYPHNNEYLSSVWLEENLKAVKNCDVLGFVDISGELEKNKDFMDSYCRGKEVFFTQGNIEVLDPGVLLDKNKIVNPWTEKLSQKKVLVVSSHKETILKQWKNIENIWGSEKKKIVPFELVDVIRSPFHPVMDGRQFDGCDSWDKSLNYMKNMIDGYDYDVLLVGAGAYSPGLADHSKKMGKIGITLCGAIQIYFGILGTRWVHNQHFAPWAKLYNEHWVYPLKEDLPFRVDVFNNFEQAYW